MGRVLGVDLGSRRIGLALSDPSRVLASPHGVLERSGDPAADRSALVAAAREAGASEIVVGVPRSLSGNLGPAARAALDEIEALRAEAAGMTVETYDERLTTVSADRALGEAGVRSRDRRRRIDAAAATVILQAYLDRRTRQ